MNIILLSGGSGQRLWPLSNSSRSKQFLKVLRNSNGDPESMVQRVYRQIKTVIPDANIIVAAEQTQLPLLQKQLGLNVNVVCEPKRRDTFPAIALSVAYYKSVMKLSDDEAVVVLPIDPYANNKYFECVKDIFLEVTKSKSSVVLMGIKPTYSSAKYGYIIPKDNSKHIKSFVEKPSEDIASKLIEQGAFWNGGVFGFKIGYIMNILKLHYNLNNYDDVYSKYDQFDKISFDYQVLEKEKNLSFCKYNNSWKDLGTWNTLTEEMNDYTSGNVVLGEETKNTHVVNELNIPLIVLGVSNSVIVATNDGILVSNKSSSSFMKKYLKNIDVEPKHKVSLNGEEITNNYSYNSNNYYIKRILLEKNSSYKINLVKNEIMIFITGEGEYTINDVGHKYFPSKSISDFSYEVNLKIESNTHIVILNTD